MDTAAVKIQNQATKLKCYPWLDIPTQSLKRNKAYGSPNVIYFIICDLVNFPVTKKDRPKSLL